MEFNLLKEKDREKIKQTIDKEGFCCFSNNKIPELEIMNGKFYEETFGFSKTYTEVLENWELDEKEKEDILRKNSLEKIIPDDFYVWRTPGPLEEKLTEIYGPGYIREIEINSDIDLLLEKIDKIHYENIGIIRLLKGQK